MLYFTLDESNSTASKAVQNGLLNVYWIGFSSHSLSLAKPGIMAVDLSLFRCRTSHE